MGGVEEKQNFGEKLRALSVVGTIALLARGFSMSMVNSVVAFFILSYAASASNVPSPVQCNSTGCTVTYYQSIWLDRAPCKAAAAIYPTNEEQLLQAVAYATKAKKKVKVVSSGSHSITKLVCPDGDDGLIISTQDYNSQILINATERTVTADAGVELRDLVNRLAEAGLTLPHTPYWDGVSVAGLISTGAHGSGIWGKGSAPHDYVVGIRIITPATEEEGYAKVVSLTAEDEDLDAARLSLGVLGAISQVKFSLEPMFKRSVRLELRDDDRLEDEMEQFAREHEFGGLCWYPASKKALLKLDDRVSVETEGEGAYKLAIVDAMEVPWIESLRAAEVEVENRRDAKALCTAYETMIIDREKLGDGLLNDGTSFTHYPVVGFNHHMQTAGGCRRSNTSLQSHLTRITPTHIELESSLQVSPFLTEEEASPLTSLIPSTCTWNPLINGLLFFDTAISIPLAHVRDAVRDIKKLQADDPNAMCCFTLYGGMWIRFVKASTAYLGERTDSVMFEIFYYRSKELNQPRFNEDLYEEIEQMLLLKYGGKPHWGKNRNLAFQDMESRTTNMKRFLETRQRFDPSGLFSSKWTNAILGISNPLKEGENVQTLQDHCALEGLCICSLDSHCHPLKRYFCRPGRVFKEARVCKYEELS